MPGLSEGLYEIGRLDELAAQDTRIHRIDPRAKVIATFAFIVCVVSFDPYRILPLVPFTLFPIALASEGRVPFGWLASRLVAAAPFAVLVGAFNPLIDTRVLGEVGPLVVTAGWVSYASIIIRFLLTTAAALVLVATTGFNTVCHALERLGVPSALATQLLFLYRYLFVLGEEGLAMSRARSLRSFDGRGMGIRVYAQLSGSLLLRTYARAQRIYSAMLTRGFDGRVRTLRARAFTLGDAVFLATWGATFIALRTVDVARLLGSLATGGFS
jgi:cobalt/nickel transport system permease protein